MSEQWDPTYYRERAKAWRERAATLPEEHEERAVCVEIAGRKGTRREGECQGRER
jgi:hypothetical protein